MRQKLVPILILIISLISLTTSPVPGQTVLQKGIMEYRAENYEEALELFKQALEKEPKSTILLFYLGLTYKQTGDFENAAKYLKEALINEPKVLDAYPVLIEMLISLDRIDEAKRWVEEAEKLKVFPAQIAFLKGMILGKEGKAKEAILAFEKAKELDKSLEQACDFQIALIHLKERRLKTARDVFRSLQKVAPDTDISRFAKEYETAVEKTLALYKPLRFTLSGSYQYDDNAASKPSKNIPGIMHLYRPRSDSIYSTSFGVEYNPYLEGRFNFILQYGFSLQKYDRRDTSDAYSHTLGAVFGYDFSRGSFSFPVNFSRVWSDYSENRDIINLRPTLNLLVKDKHILQFGFGVNLTEVKRPALLREEDPDEKVYSSLIGYIYPLKEGRGIFNLRAEYTWNDPDGRNLENRASRFGVILLYPLIERLKLNLNGEYAVVDYQNINSLSGRGVPGYPDEPKKRKDRVLGLGGGITYELFKNFNLNLKYDLTKNKSNFDINKYKKNVYTLGFTYIF